VQNEELHGLNYSSDQDRDTGGECDMYVGVGRKETRTFLFGGPVGKRQFRSSRHRWGG